MTGYALALVTDSVEVGGAEVFLRHLAGALPVDVTVHVVARDAAVAASVTQARAGTTATVVPAGVRPALRALRAARPDVVHVNLTAFASCRDTLVAGLLLRLPVVLVDHLPTPGLTWRGRAVQRLMTRRASARVAVGERASRLVERYGGLRAGSVGTIMNGVPMPAQRIPPPGAVPCVIGLLGRLEPQKGVDLALRALADLPDLRLVVQGSGREAAALAALAAELGVQDRVRFLPGASGTERFWEEVDVLLLPSRAEALPLVVLEALAHGRPVVATDVGSVAEVVDDEVGRLVPPEDVPALVRAVRQLAEDHALRRRMGEAARARSASYDVTRTAEAYDRLYREVLTTR